MRQAVVEQAGAVKTVASSREEKLRAGSPPTAPSFDTSYNANTKAQHAAELARQPDKDRARMVLQKLQPFGNQHVGQVIALSRQTAGAAAKRDSALEAAPVAAVASAALPAVKAASAQALAPGRPSNLKMPAPVLGGVMQQQSAALAGGEDREIQHKAGGSAPASPTADEAFQDVVHQSQGVSEQEQTHQPPQEKSQEAQEAAEPPANDVESKAQGRQVSKEMAEAPKPPFNKSAFKDALMERIVKITPKNLDEMDKFKGSGQLADVKQDVTGQVKDQQQATQGPLEKTTKETPATAGIPKKPVTPLPPNLAGPLQPTYMARKRRLSHSRMGISKLQYSKAARTSTSG